MEKRELMKLLDILVIMFFVFFPAAAAVTQKQRCENVIVILREKQHFGSKANS